MPNLGGWELIILLGVVVLVFGAKRLPDMARSIGQSARVLKGEMKGLRNQSETSPAPRVPASAPAVTADVQRPGGGAGAERAVAATAASVVDGVR